MVVVVENMWDRFPDAGPPALTEMKVSPLFIVVWDTIADK
jgi:hypothetical protein